MVQIFLDTNGLMAIGEFGIDVFDELEKLCDFKYEAIVLDKVIEELKKIGLEQRGKYKRASKLALGLIEGRTKIVKSKEGYVDDLLVEVGKKGGIVLTQDKELKKRVKLVGGKVIVIRQKKRLVWG